MTFGEWCEICKAQLDAEPEKPMVEFISEMSGFTTDDIETFVNHSLMFVMEMDTGDAEARSINLATCLLGALQLGVNLGKAAAAAEMTDFDAAVEDFTITDAGGDTA